MAIISATLAAIFGIDSLADFLSLGTLIAYSMSEYGLLLLRYCPTPEILIPVKGDSGKGYIDPEKEELERAITSGQAVPVSLHNLLPLLVQTPH